MLRFVAVAALAAALSSPAFAEPGFVRTISLPALGASYGVAPKAACELPMDVSTLQVAPAAAGQAMTLSPRMMQAIRIDETAAVD